MKSVKKEVSFRRKLMTAVLSVTLPLIALLLFSNLYSTQAFNRKIADSNMRTMDYRVGRMEEQLEITLDAEETARARALSARAARVSGGRGKQHLDADGIPDGADGMARGSG